MLNDVWWDKKFKNVWNVQARWVHLSKKLRKYGPHRKPKIVLFSKNYNDFKWVESNTRFAQEITLRKIDQLKRKQFHCVL